MTQRAVRKIIFQSALTAALLVVGIAAFFVHRERETLARLAHPETVPSGTLVYSRWLDMSPRVPCSLERLTKWLEVLQYRRVEGRPTQPGEYSSGLFSLDVFTHPFSYPDGDYPAQLLT